MVSIYLGKKPTGRAKPKKNMILTAINLLTLAIFLWSAVLSMAYKLYSSAFKQNIPSNKYFIMMYIIYYKCISSQIKNNIHLILSKIKIPRKP